MSDYVIRPFETIQELHECVGLQEETWGRGFSERVSPALLKVTQILGCNVYPDLVSVPSDIDLAVIALPAAAVMDVMEPYLGVATNPLSLMRIVICCNLSDIFIKIRSKPDWLKT